MQKQTHGSPVGKKKVFISLNKDDGLSYIRYTVLDSISFLFSNEMITKSYSPAAFY